MQRIDVDSAGSKRKLYLLVQIAFILVVLFIAYNQPYCHDDWSWGLSGRVKMLKNGFSGYNGRYLGNILIMVITRSRFAKILLPTVCMFWLLRSVLACGRSTESHEEFELLLLLETMFLLAAIPASLYAQSYGWLAAFSNFAPPTVCFLIWFHHSEWIYEKEGRAEKDGIPAAILYLLLGIASQLFAEHCTIFITAYALWTVLLPLIRRRKLPVVHITYALGCLTGAVMMYANPVYRSGLASTNKNAFKGITLSVSALYYQLRDRMLKDLFLNNVLLNVLLALATAVLVIFFCRHLFVKRLVLPVYCGYAFYLVWHQLNPKWSPVSDAGRLHTLQLFLCALYVLCLLAGILDSITSSERWVISVLYLGSLAAAAPLMAANPIGTRCFYFTYLLQCVVLIRLTSYLLGSYHAAWTSERIQSAELCAGVLVICLSVVYMHMFGAIGRVERSRAAIMQTAIAEEQTEIILPLSPYASYTWKTEPETDTWRKYFKMFYGIPQETKIYFE